MRGEKPKPTREPVSNEDQKLLEEARKIWSNYEYFQRKYVEGKRGGEAMPTPEDLRAALERKDYERVLRLLFKYADMPGAFVRPNIALDNKISRKLGEERVKIVSVK
ncbi:MAG: hypothetical protein QXO12_01750 [Candidatus Pacearchaeota archaeon]